MLSATHTYLIHMKVNAAASTTPQGMGMIPRLCMCMARWLLFDCADSHLEGLVLEAAQARRAHGTEHWRLVLIRRVVCVRHLHKQEALHVDTNKQYVRSCAARHMRCATIWHLKLQWISAAAGK